MNAIFIDNMTMVTKRGDISFTVYQCPVTKGMFALESSWVEHTGVSVVSPYSTGVRLNLPDGETVWCTYCEEIAIGHNNNDELCCLNHMEEVT